MAYHMRGEQWLIAARIGVGEIDEEAGNRLPQSHHRTRFPLSMICAYCAAPAFERSPVTGCDRAMPTMAPPRVSAITLLAMRAVPAPGATETAIPILALRTTFPVAATSRR